MSKGLLFIVEDDVNQIRSAQLFGSKYGLKTSVSETYEEAIEKFIELISQKAKNIIILLDGQFPSESDTGRENGLRFLESRLIIPDEHFLIANSGISEINAQMVKIWEQKMQGDASRILSSSGKPTALSEGLQNYTLLESKGLVA